MSPRSQPRNLPPGRSVEIEWMTLSYKTIAILVVAVFALIMAVLYLISPGFVQRTAIKALEMIAANPTVPQSNTGRKEAHFVNLDGTVKIKKAASSQWIRADFNTSLERGDFVQTGSDGVARIIFSDGTNYTLKPDALIVVEENREDPVTRATKVAVQVTSGAVDLATGRFETPGSTSQVSFADATASLNENSRAGDLREIGRAHV